MPRSSSWNILQVFGQCAFAGQSVGPGERVVEFVATPFGFVKSGTQDCTVEVLVRPRRYHSYDLACFVQATLDQQQVGQYLHDQRVVEWGTFSLCSRQ
jgi:hypothetical protein